MMGEEDLERIKSVALSLSQQAFDHLEDIDHRGVVSYGMDVRVGEFVVKVVVDALPRNPLDRIVDHLGDDQRSSPQ